NIITINNKNINSFDTNAKPITNTNSSENTNGSYSSASVMVERINGYWPKQDFFTKNYKTIIAATSILAAYGISFYTITYCKNYLENENLWSCWKKEISIEKLMEIPHDMFAQQVLEQIKMRYENKNNLVISLTQFMNDIEKEKKILTAYSKVYNFLNKYYLLTIFPIDTKSFETINENLERLAYIKNVFLSSEYINNYDKIYIDKKKIKYI
ncbi:MAG: hypothetical protein ACD_82C00030G0001, partial [uncultured bacterium]